MILCELTIYIINSPSALQEYIHFINLNCTFFLLVDETVLSYGVRLSENIEDIQIATSNAFALQEFLCVLRLFSFVFRRALYKLY